MITNYELATSHLEQIGAIGKMIGDVCTEDRGSTVFAFDEILAHSQNLRQEVEMLAALMDRRMTSRLSLVTPRIERTEPELRVRELPVAEKRYQSI